MPSTAQTATAKPTGQSLSQDQYLQLLPAQRWQDPQHSLCPVGHCLFPLHCSRHQRRANCPKISQEGGQAGKAPLNTHPQNRGGPQGRNMGPLGEAGFEPGFPWPYQFGPHPRCPQMEHGHAMPWPKPYIQEKLLSLQPPRSHM